MKKFWKTVLCLGMSALFTLGAAGCFDKNTEDEGGDNRNTQINVADSLVDYSVYRDTAKAKIYAWRGPTDLSDTQWQAFKDSGINTLIIDSTIDGRRGQAFGTAEQESYIRKCKEYGLKAIGFTNGNLAPSIKSYAGSDLYDTIDGINYVDEPKIDAFEGIAAVIGDFSAKYPGKTFFTCMNSSYASLQQLGGPQNYQEYIDTWYDVVLSQLPAGMPRVMATDVYPFHVATNGQSAYTNETWVRTLAYMADLKKRHNELILHMVMQASSYGYERNTVPRRNPQDAECLLSAYVNLAFGITEFSWYTYSTPPVDDLENKEEDYAMMDRDGNLTETYYAVKKANTVINNLDEVLLSSDWQGIYPIQKNKNRDKNAFSYVQKFDNILVEIADMNTVKSFDADNNALVGMFTDENGNEGFLIVNYGDPTEEIDITVTAEFIDCNKLIVYRDGLPTTIDLVGGKAELPLSAGEGVYVIPYKA